MLEEKARKLALALDARVHETEPESGDFAIVVRTTPPGRKGPRFVRITERLAEVRNREGHPVESVKLSAWGSPDWAEELAAALGPRAGCYLFDRLPFSVPPEPTPEPTPGVVFERDDGAIVVVSERHAAVYRGWHIIRSPDSFEVCVSMKEGEGHV